MQPKRFFWANVLYLATSFPVFANLKGTVTLNATIAFSFDTGSTSSSVGDILWDGSNLTPQGGASASDLKLEDSYFFNTATRPILMSFTYSQSAIPAALLPALVFAFHTVGDNYAIARILNVTGTSLTLEYATFGTGPTITLIQNNYSYVLPGYPNYGIAPSSLFIVVGAGLTDPSIATLQSSQAPGLPLTLNGASLSVIVGGVTVQPGIYYATPTQIAAVMPAATPIGAGTLVVTYKGMSSDPAPILVTQSALGFDTYFGIGSGPAVATDPPTGTLFTFTNSARPGQTIVLWGSGLGADLSVSDTTFTVPTRGVNTPLQIYIGGVQATIVYQGSSGYPGLNQINVTVPDSVPTGCTVPVGAINGLIVSNSVTLPIAANGGVCNDAAFGTNGTSLAGLNPQQRVVVGQLAAGISTAPQTIPSPGSFANASFQRMSGTGYLVSGPRGSIGSCVINTNLLHSFFPSSFQAGGSLIITTPIGTYGMTEVFPFGDFIAGVSAGAIPPGSTVMFSGFVGSPSIVGSIPVSAQANIPSLPFTWTNESTAGNVDRTKGLTVTWSGSAPGSYVQISGNSYLSDGEASASSGFSCYASADVGRFTVPPYILLGLPAGQGSTQVQNISALQSFSAAGMDFGLGTGAVSYAAASNYR